MKDLLVPCQKPMAKGKRHKNSSNPRNQTHQQIKASKLS